MKKLKYDYVVFDFDGTLFDTGDGILKTVRLALDFYNINSNEFPDMHFFIGPPLVDSFQRFSGVDEEMANKLVAKYREHYRETGLLEGRLYDGVSELLSFLKSNRVKIGIGSSKPKHFIKDLLQYKNMENLFDEVSAVTPENSKEPKSEIIKRCLTNMECTEFSRALMVGDRCFDIDGARQIGIDSVGVLYGYGSKEEFEECGATYIVENCKEIEQLVQMN